VLALCLFTPLPDIIKFVCIVMLVLAGCSVAGFVLWRERIDQMSDNPMLVSQKVKAIDTLADMGERVTMDTMNYLKAVRTS
jgi:uncharacterized protein YneF (UPF0154 family)